MFAKLTDYKTGRPVLVNLDNIICIKGHEDRLGKQSEAVKGSRMFANVHTATGTSAIEPYPVDVRESPKDIEDIILTAKRTRGSNE